MMDISVAEKLLELVQKKVSQAEVVFSEGERRTITFEDDKLKTVEADFSSGLGLRLINGGRVGVAATNKFDDLSVLVDRAIVAAEFGPQARFEFPPQSNFSEPKVYSQEIEEVTNEDLVARGREIIEVIKEYNPKISVDLGFAAGVGKAVLLNSAGLEVKKEGTSVGFEMVGKIFSEGDFLEVVEVNEACRDELHLDFYLERLIEKFKKAEKIAKIKPGQYPIIFTPQSFGSVLDFVTTALNGKMVVKKSSRLMDKLGQQVFDRRLTIFDDGTLDWRMGSGKCDSEGIPVRPLDLIENGVVKNFYYDLQTAGQMKTESTGHGSRSKVAALASPSLRNVLIKEGGRSYDSILRCVREGILAEQFLGEGQDNPFNGDFSFNLHLGYKIENGEIVGRVKDTMVAGNAFELLRDGVGEISCEAEWVGNSFKCPYVVLEGLTVNSKS